MRQLANTGQADDAATAFECVRATHSLLHVSFAASARAPLRDSMLHVIKLLRRIRQERVQKLRVHIFGRQSNVVIRRVYQ